MKALLLALLAVLTASSSGAQVPLTLDTSFRCTRLVNSGLSSILPLADGSIIATAYLVYIDNCCNSDPYGWFRFLSNGDLDESWSGPGTGGDIQPYALYYYAPNSGFPHRYFQANGEPDYSFSVGAANNAHPGLLLGNGGGIFVQANGKVLCTGDHYIAEQWGPNAPGYYSLLRVDADATLDSTYEYRQTDGVIWTIEPTTQGRFLLSGVYNTYGGLPEGRILRIWPDGSLDSTFHSDIIKGYAECYVQQPNGRIIAGGQFVMPNDPDTMHLIRLMPDGALDTSFSNHAEYKGQVSSFGDFGFAVKDALQLVDGRIIVGGEFNHINGQLRRGIALLDSTGHLLNTAFTGQGCGLMHDFNSTFMYSGIETIRMAPDGSIFLCGAFRGFDDGTVSDTSITMICKLHGLSVGIHEPEQPSWNLQVFPNPGTDVLHIESDTKGRTDVRVRDATGRAVLTAGDPSGSLELNSACLSPSVYLIEVSTAEGRRMVKWIKR
jgi:hypothetical protein